MKDYIVAENQQLLGTAGIAQIAAQTAQNTHEIAVVSAAHKIHDRYILVDFKTKSEKLYHCGASSKDAGNKITTIVQLDDIEGCRNMFEKLYAATRSGK